VETSPTSDDPSRGSAANAPAPCRRPRVGDGRVPTDVLGRSDVPGTAEDLRERGAAPTDPGGDGPGGGGPRHPGDGYPGDPGDARDRGGPDGGKGELRARIRVARRARALPERHSGARELARTVTGLPEVRRAGTVTCYVSFPTEPGTGPLRLALREAGIRVLLPVTLPRGVLDWVADPGPSPDGEDRGGDPPAGAGPRLGRAAIGTADVLLVPALAVDALGHRLGQGGGYYDRALPLARPDAPVVALLHADEFWDAGAGTVPSLPHDRGVDVVALPGGIVRIPRGS